MRKMKKLIAVILALVMILTMTSPAFAASGLTASQIKAITPTGIKAASYTYSKIKVSWDKIDGVDGYVVYRATSKTGKYEKAYTTTNPDKLYYINTGRTTGKYYYYKVRGFKKIGKTTYYTKYSAASGTYARPNKVKINEVYGMRASISDIVLDWQPVSGATRYECQVNQKSDGKWSGWRSYSYDDDGQKSTFRTYYTLLASDKKDYPSGYVTTLINGEIKKVTVEEAVASVISKTQAWIDVLQDDTVYKFRVRAYRTVNGKKVYGAWSDEYTLKETLDTEALMTELRHYTIDYAKKNFPEFTYLDDRKDSTPENSGYYVQGDFGAFTRYIRKEDALNMLKDQIARYLDNCRNGGGEKEGFLYLRRSSPGTWEGMWKNDTEETYYYIWMLY